MGNFFCILEANDEGRAELLASMHHLRWQVFHQELQWTEGLMIRNCMEFDQYDCAYAKYIVRINPYSQVDACCRLIPTDKPYMLAEHYPHFIQTQPIPHDARIWEISRVAVSKTLREQTRSRILPQLIAAMLEYGLASGIDSFVSLTTDHLVPALESAGWDSAPLGKKGSTPNDKCYALIQTVSADMLMRIRPLHSIPGQLLHELDLSGFLP